MKVKRKVTLRQALDDAEAKGVLFTAGWVKGPVPAIERNDQQLSVEFDVGRLRHHRAKLHEWEVREILKLYAGGVSQRQLAKRYCVSQPTISQVVHGDTWKHIIGQRKTTRRTYPE